MSAKGVAAQSEGGGGPGRDEPSSTKGKPTGCLLPPPPSLGVTAATLEMGQAPDVRPRAHLSAAGSAARHRLP